MHFESDTRSVHRNPHCPIDDQVAGVAQCNGSEIQGCAGHAGQMMAEEPSRHTVYEETSQRAILSTLVAFPDKARYAFLSL